VARSSKKKSARSKRQAVILVGGGEHARVVAEAVRSRPDLFELLGFVDPEPCDETVTRLSLPRLGGDEALSKHKKAFVLVSVGPTPGSITRERIVNELVGSVAGFATVVHEAAWVSPTAVLDEGVVVLAGAVVNSGARIGPHAVVNSGATIEHDVALGAFAHVAPGATLGGGASVGASAHVGLSACIRDHVRVGSRALVAMGAVVVRDVADGALVKGVPAK
jgi:acetyltransferase EpsM